MNHFSHFFKQHSVVPDLQKCEDLMLVFVIYDSKLNIFGFWTVCQIKQGVGRHYHGLWK